MTMTIDAPVRNAQAATILQRSVCLVLFTHYLGNNRKVDLPKLVQESGGTLTLDEEQFHTSMKLVDQKVLRAPMRVLGKVKKYLTSRATTAHRVFGDSTYLLALPLVEEVDAALEEYVVELAVESRLAAERYDAAVAAQREKVGALFDASKYPSAADVASAFSFGWRYVSFAAPERLETVDRALFEAAQRRHEGDMAELFADTRLVLRETARQIVGEMVKKLTPGEDGKPKVFRASTLLSDLSDFLATVDVRNITDDAELGQVAARLRDLTDGLDPAALQDSDSLRASVLAQAMAATDALDGLVATGRRGIRFD